ncbi:MAG: cyclase family protein [Rhodobacter sp.]|uniref:cyclase family protein n=1 Tax=Pararhodobacter sp. TaxID=2127056 RepID=UPI001D4DFF1F|nr:cyclase family protein [Pararhodobacter sp.]MCB1346133.1 cyclase family protein [Paracoccaceae bacterium]MCC0073362.1 cyclase family protein [Rhodobacter sp.]HPD91178.1 cyclase family protein [Pararhodobacter sp.]
MTRVLETLARALSGGGVRIVDLTQTLRDDFPTIVLPPEFAPSAPIRIERVSHYDAAGPSWYWNNLSFGEHSGTHFDAPAHWFTGRDRPLGTVDTMPCAHMVAPACVIDCSDGAALDDDFLLTRPMIEAWEDRHGAIPAGSWVLMRTDWSARSGAAYAGLRDDGAHTPGPDAEAIRHLVHARGILGFGTETIGTDAGQGGHFEPPYPAHHYLHGAGRYGLQCLTNLHLLPPKGAMLMTAPLKVHEGSGSPLRVLALVEGEDE